MLSLTTVIALTEGSLVTPLPLRSSLEEAKKNIVMLISSCVRITKWHSFTSRILKRIIQNIVLCRVRDRRRQEIANNKG